MNKVNPNLITISTLILGTKVLATSFYELFVLHNKSVNCLLSADDFEVYRAINSSGNCLLCSANFLKPNFSKIGVILFTSKSKCKIINTDLEILLFWKEIVLRLWMYMLIVNFIFITMSMSGTGSTQPHYDN
jgi:hypothetical protein